MAKGKRRAVILHNAVAPDARKDDLDTLVEVAAVESALAELGIDASRVEFSLDLKRSMEAIREAKPDFVFNLVESIDGQDRYVYLAPAMLDYLKIPYTGSCTESLFVASNKLLAKDVFRGAKIPTPGWVTLDGLAEGLSGGLADGLGGGLADGSSALVEGEQYIVKSTWDHASLGLSDESVFIATNAEDAARRIRAQQKIVNSPCFAERFITGREINLSLIGTRNEFRILPAAEIVFRDYPEGKPRIVSYDAKWNEESFEYRNTVRTFEFAASDRSMLDRVRETARICWSTFKLNGYVRVDFRIDEAGHPWVLEINVNPCISPDAGLVAAVERDKKTYVELIQWICDGLVIPEREGTPHRFEIEREYASRL